MSSTDASVSSIIAAFTSGLDIFKKLREKRQRKKAKQTKRQSSSKSDEETQLSRSLQRGSQDVQAAYEDNYRGLGPKYAVGDGTPLISVTLALGTNIYSNRTRLASTYAAET